MKPPAPAKRALPAKRASRPRDTALARPAPADPMVLFARWLRHAERREPSNPNAMILATVDNARPSARVVLLKDVDAEGGFVFYTDTRSRKGRELAETPNAALVFYWKHPTRQVRIVGSVEPVSDEQADAYFATRPRGSQIGARASRQSRLLVGGRAKLHQCVRRVERQFQGVESVPRPSHWSGWRLQADEIEFWSEGKFRLHDRVLYTRNKSDARASLKAWKQAKLFP